MTVEEFKLPDVGEGVAEGELVRWLVEPGDPVTEDQPVAEVETDKSLVEIPSPYDGTVRERMFAEGDVVPVGAVLVTFDVGDEPDDEPTAAESTPAEPVEGEAEPPNGTSGDAEPADAGVAEPKPTNGEPAASGRVFAPPSVRRLARELGVDLEAVDGSGPGGRVSEGDVRAAAETAGGSEDDAGTDERGADADDASSTPRAVQFSGKSAVSRRDEAGDGETAASGDAVAPAGRDRTLAAPATRRVARELGVELNDVPAVEEREDGAFVDEAAVRAYAEATAAATAGADGTEAESTESVEAGTEPEPTTGDADAAPAPRSVDFDGADAAVSAAGDGPAVEPATPTAGDDPSPPEPSPAAADRRDAGGLSGERVPYRGVRRATGEAMQRSAFTAPHVTHTDVADAEALVELREELKPLAAERDVKLTYLPFVLKACAVALQEFPIVNALLDEAAGEILLRDDYHLGVATATDAGLFVPVVRDVDAKGLARIAADTNDLVSRARDRSIDRAELRGSTFTVTNVGAIGGEFATPILNYPEAGILALGAIEQRPSVVDGEVVARHTLPLSLSFDHRVFDGATAAEFTNRLIELLEEPRGLLL